jgi:hypothetical protein
MGTVSSPFQLVYSRNCSRGKCPIIAGRNIEFEKVLRLFELPIEILKNSIRTHQSEDQSGSDDSDADSSEIDEIFRHQYFTDRDQNGRKNKNAKKEKTDSSMKEYALANPVQYFPENLCLCHLQDGKTCLGGLSSDQIVQLKTDFWGPREESLSAAARGERIFARLRAAHVSKSKFHFRIEGLTVCERGYLFALGFQCKVFLFHFLSDDLRLIRFIAIGNKTSQWKNAKAQIAAGRGFEEKISRARFSKSNMKAHAQRFINTFAETCCDKLPTTNQAGECKICVPYTTESDFYEEYCHSINCDGEAPCSLSTFRVGLSFNP